MADQSAAQLPNGVASGDTTESSSVLWARGTAAGNLTFDYSTDPTFATRASAVVTVSDPLVPVKQKIHSLEPSTRYYYRATDAAGMQDAGTFKTAAPAGLQAGLRFGVSGDWRGELAPYPSIRNAIPGGPATGLDFFVALGDTIYSDVESPALPGVSQALTLPQFRAKHNEVYSARHGLNTLADLRRSTSLFAMIDDHEVTNDFQGYATVPAGADPHPIFQSSPGTPVNDSVLYDNGLRAFDDYNPIDERAYANTGADPRMDGEIKLYRSQAFGKDAMVIVPDARSFRDPGLPAANPVDPASVSNFLVSAFDPGRTMLGARQLADIKADLTTAQNGGITWKFVMVPEPIQNLGVALASDRFEGYAAERADLLNFIKQDDIQNVVFVAADIHGMVVNNLTYQLGPGQPQIATSAWEITTPAVGYDFTLGPLVASAAFSFGIPGALSLAEYNALSTAQKDAYVNSVLNGLIAPLGYDPLGLQGSLIPVTLLQGSYVATNALGWTEFEIDRDTQQLLVTTYGIPPYDAAAAAAGTIVGQQPVIISQFRVVAIPEPASVILAAVAFLAGTAVGWRHWRAAARIS